MSLYDFSNAYDAAANAANQTFNTQVVGVASSASDAFPSVVGNAVQSALTQAAQYTIMGARSDVSQKLTSLLNSAIPRSNNSILNNVNNLVRGSLGNTSGALLNGGVNTVLAAIGFGQNTPVRNSNPTVYNNGIAAAQALANQVNGGNTNVSQMVADAVPALAALQYAHQTYVSTTTTPGGAGVSPYAMDLFQFAPKYNYLYIVDITFVNGFEALGQLNGQRSKFAMIVQDFDRPKITYDHEEFNWYNFRSKYPKRVTHDNLRLRFIDDRQNASMTFITQYLIATHPIVGVSPMSSFMYEDAGMNWTADDNQVTYDAVNSASLRGLAGDQLNAIAEIKVYHIYDYGRNMNVYHFIRPKLVSIELDKWDMKGSSEGCSIETEFAYDGLYIETGLGIGTGEESKIELLTQADKYPMRPVQHSASAIAVQDTTPTSYSTTGDVQTFAIDPTNIQVTPIS